MVVLYQILLFFYVLLIRIAARFGTVKAQLWLNGRKQWKEQLTDLPPGRKKIWVHCASLGEFEQARPVIEAMKEQFPDRYLVLTFFSPSGYEIRKNYAGADKVMYLPMDAPKAAKDFIQALNPTQVIFTKYEYWYFYFMELKRKGIPLYVISAIFRREQAFFRWYGALHRKMLACVTRFFVQNEASVELIKTLGFQQVSIAGDTRFDRVWQNRAQAKELPFFEAFADGFRVVVAGSTWPKDEALLASWIASAPSNYKLILAPHEIDEAHLKHIRDLFGTEALFFSAGIDFSKARILIVDTIGLLSSIYRYGSIAYIGGGFDKGIHNTLEAAVFGMPVVFGPRFEKFKEAKELIDRKAAFSIQGAKDWENVLFCLQNGGLEQAQRSAEKYVLEQRGATEYIVKAIC